MKKIFYPILFALLFSSLACTFSSLIPAKEDGSSQSGNNNVLFQDNFSNTNSGWDRSEGEDGITDYGEGFYRMVVKTPSYDIWANPGKFFDSDVRVTADVAKVDGEDDNNFGLLCRYSGEAPTQNYYFFNISSDGFAVIGKVVAGTEEYISTEQMEPSDAIHQGNAQNHLRADCIGNTLTFFVNDTQIAQTTDDSFSQGDVGLIAGTFDIPSTEVHFSNFSVSKP